MDIDHLPYVAARLQKSRGGAAVTVVVIHDMEAPEGPLTAENVARYFQSDAAKGSAHINADNNSCVQCVPYNMQAAAAPGSNTNGVHIELAGYARQTRLEWLDPYSMDTLEHGADCVAQFLKKFNLPNKYLDAAALLRGEKGWTTHWQVTLAFKRSTHTDPGQWFPLDYFQTRINYYYYGEDEEMDQATIQAIMDTNRMTGEIYQAVIGTDVPAWGENNPRHNSIMTRLYYMFSLMAAGENTQEFAALLDNAVGNAADIDALGEQLDKIEADLKALNPSA